MKKHSIWTENISIKDFNQLNKNIDTDILIIGAGITGITTAYKLINNNLKITIVEQNRIGMGVTSKTTGKINFLQETVYSDIKNKYSYNIAKKYLESQQYTINDILKIIDKENIDCNLTKTESYVFTNKKNEINKIKEEKNILESMNIKVKEHKKINIPLHCKYAISVDDTYVFHPLKFINKLVNICNKNNVDIYENTKIIKIDRENNKYICYTKTNKIYATKVIIACHYPYFLFPFIMPLKVYNERSYIICSKTNKCQNKTYITSNKSTKSIRYHKDKNKYILYLSNSHKTGNDLNENKNFNNTIKEFKKINLNIDYIWSNEDLITVDKIPYIGRIEKNNNDLLIATGYNTWGMTNSILASNIIRDIIFKKKNKYEELTDPNRTNTSVNLINIMENIITNIKNYSISKLVKNKKWYKNVTFTKRKGKDIAIYTENNKKYIVYTKCPHLGCTLVFNEYEKTWDCPCHASRFNLEGKCIKGPSIYNITYKEDD